MGAHGRQQNSWARQQNFGARFANKMADVNRRANLVACYLLILSILRRRRGRRVPRRHRFWIRQIYQKREELGAYHTLVQELRLHENLLYRHSYFCTSSINKEELSSDVAAILVKIRELQGNLRAKARKMVTGMMLSGIDFDRPDRPDRLRVFPFDRF